MQYAISSSNELRDERHIYVSGILLAGRASESARAEHERTTDVAGRANARWKDPSCDAHQSQIIASGLPSGLFLTASSAAARFRVYGSEQQRDGFASFVQTQRSPSLPQIEPSQ